MYNYCKNSELKRLLTVQKAGELIFADFNFNHCAFNLYFQNQILSRISKISSP